MGGEQANALVDQALVVAVSEVDCHTDARPVGLELEWIGATSLIPVHLI